MRGIISLILASLLVAGCQTYGNGGFRAGGYMPPAPPRYYAPPPPVVVVQPPPRYYAPPPQYRMVRPAPPGMRYFPTPPAVIGGPGFYMNW